MTTNVVDSVPAQLLHQQIVDLGVTHVVTVPDTHQRTLLTGLYNEPRLKVITVSTEDEAICINAGLWMGGQEPILLIQNLGVFAAMNALRGIAPEETEKNLDAMLTRLRERGIAVLLAGMMAPPNMGADYAERFNGIYKRLADKHGVPLYPFFLDGVVTHANLQIEDGMHPNPEGVDVMVRSFLPAAEAFLASIKAGE